MERKEINIFECQEQLLSNFLGGLDDDDECLWKILIFDDYCQQLLSTIYREGNLRDKNITLKFNIRAQREKLFGVKTLYFVQPTQKNIEQIVQDCKENLYDQLYLNFAYKIDNNLFEKLAIEIGKIGCTQKIKKVCYHPLNYVTLSKNLFTFNFDEVYSSFLCQIMDKNTQNQFYKQIANNLFCFFESCQIYPAIYYQGNNQNSVTIIEELQKIMDSREFSEEEELQKFNQPQMILIDREIDLGSMILHPWYYGALIHDILNIKNNKVEFCNELTNNVKMYYDLDPQMDKYWADKINTPLPDVVQESAQQLDKYQHELDNMSHKQSSNQAEVMSENLANALDMVPEMTEKKRRLEVHTNLSQHLCNEVKKRKLDECFELGNNLIFNKELTKQEYSQFSEILKSKEGNEFDKLRIILLYILYCKSLNIKKLNEFIEFAGFIQQQNLKIIQFFKQKSNLNQQVSKEENIDANQMLPNFVSGLANQLKSKSKDVLLNLQTQIQLNQSKFLLASLLQSLIESKGKSLQQNFQVHDLLAQKNVQKQKNNKDYIIFVSDMGNYNEYASLMEVGAKLGKNILYGSSCIGSAEDWIKQVGKVIDIQK